jgi:oligopeptide/dipeptide ABC transporter ATP-binding protein
LSASGGSAVRQSLAGSGADAGVTGTAAAPLLQVRELDMQYPLRREGLFGPRRAVHALQGVSLEVRAGQTVALVGESGCGKSTLGKCILRLVEPTGGEVLVEGERFAGAGVALRTDLRQRMQVIFQDPYASLNPRRTVLQSVADPLVQAGVGDAAERRRRVLETLAQVGLDASFAERHPHELSGGQRQRVAIARAIVMRPKLIVCDEPISSLDISIQAQVINLLLRLQRELGVAYLFITHDLRLVPRIADRVVVMYLGQVVEEGPARLLEQSRLHPYSQALFGAVPRIEPAGADRAPRRLLEGEIPSPIDPPSGCRFHTRCPHRQDRCAREAPELRPLDGRLVRCHYAGSLD